MNVLDIALTALVLIAAAGAAVALLSGWKPSRCGGGSPKGPCESCLAKTHNRKAASTKD